MSNDYKESIANKKSWTLVPPASITRIILLPTTRCSLAGWNKSRTDKAFSMTLWRCIRKPTGRKDASQCRRLKIMLMVYWRRFRSLGLLAMTKPIKAQWNNCWVKSKSKLCACKLKSARLTRTRLTFIVCQISHSGARKLNIVHRPSMSIASS